MAKLMGAKPSMITEHLESLAGKTRTEQSASLHNEGVNTRIIRKGLGLDEGNEITPKEVQEVRKEAGEAYEAVKKVPGDFAPQPKDVKALENISGVASRVAKKFPGVFKNDKIDELVNGLKSGTMSSEEAVEITKKLRLDANSNRASQDAQVKALGAAQKRAADVVEDMLSRHLKASNQPQLYAAFTKARQVIAKSYDVEKSITDKNKIDAVKLAKLGKKRPLSDELKDVAEFGAKFKGAARDTSKAGSRLGPEVSKTELGAAALGFAAGHPGMSIKAATAAVTAMAPAIARKYILSDLAQRAMVQGPATLEQLVLPRAGAIAGAEATQ